MKRRLGLGEWNVVLGDRCRGSGEGIGKERRRGLGTGLEKELKGNGRSGATRVRGITGWIGGLTTVLGFGSGGMSFLIKTKDKIVVKKL